MRDFTGTVLAAAMLLGLSSGAQAVPLTVVNVGAPAVNCVFNPACTVTVTDTIGNYPPSSGYTGTPRLQSRTYVGVPGAPAAGLTAYVYRVDFTSATARADINCAVNLKVRFGPNARLNYGGGGPADVFVVTTGGLGSIGLASADRTGAVVTFTFTKPVCPTNGISSPGQTSFFFGMASKLAPNPSVAKSDLTFGGGTVNVLARAP
jgi:hypothetical protein